MKNRKNNMSSFILLLIIWVLTIPSIVFSFEPIATIGKPSPENHAFLTDQTLLRTSYYSTMIQIIDRDTGDILDEFDIRPRYSEVVINQDASHMAIIEDISERQTTKVSIWDVNTRKLVSEWETQVDFSSKLEFSPVEPFLVNSVNNEFNIWNWETGEFVAEMTGERRPTRKCYVVETIRDNGRSVSKTCASPARDHDLLFTPDGKFLIVASQRPDIELWNIETQEIVGHFEGHTGDWVDGLAISPDGKHLASFENGSNYLYLWDVVTKQLLWKEPIDDDGISAVLFSPDGKHLYAADRNLYILDVESGERIDAFGNDYLGFHQMVLSPDGKTVLLQYDGGHFRGGVVELWDIETRNQVNVFSDFAGGIVELSPDGETMVSEETYFIKIWDVQSQKVRFHKNDVFFFGKGFAISPDNTELAYSNYPHAEVADLRTGRVKLEIKQHVSLLDDAAFSKTGRFLAGVGGFGDLYIWDLNNPALQVWLNNNHLHDEHNIKRVAFSDNDSYLAVSTRTDNANNQRDWISLWKRIGGTFEFQYLWETQRQGNTKKSPLAFATARDGSTVLAVAGIASTQIWQIQLNKANLVSTLPGASVPINFSPDRKFLFTERNQELQIWDWQKSKRINFPSIPRYMGISEDGSILVSSDEVGHYLIWDAKDMFANLPQSVEARDKQLVTLGQIKKNQLMQNFPNPFNPETWIPFQLAEESHVTIDIFNPTGEIIRTLSLGKMSAGDYSTHTKAAHWDGRNDDGETVSSGIYFYNIKAGEFSATRKMLIKK